MCARATCCLIGPKSLRLSQHSFRSLALENALLNNIQDSWNESPEKAQDLQRETEGRKHSSEVHASVKPVQEQKEHSADKLHRDASELLEKLSCSTKV